MKSLSEVGFVCARDRVQDRNINKDNYKMGIKDLDIKDMIQAWDEAFKYKSVGYKIIYKLYKDSR